MKSRSVTFLVTIGLWVALCGLSLAGLVRSAHRAQPGTIEEYARHGSFQAINFVIGYLPILLLILGAVLGLEWCAFRGIDFITARGRK
jgi:hypothetical protein